MDLQKRKAQESKIRICDKLKSNRPFETRLGHTRDYKAVKLLPFPFSVYLSPSRDHMLYTRSFFHQPPKDTDIRMKGVNSERKQEKRGRLLPRSLRFGAKFKK